MTENSTEFLPGDDPRGDVEGHIRPPYPLETVDDEVEGHVRPAFAAEPIGEDVEGHRQPPRDLDIEF